MWKGTYRKPNLYLQEQENVKLVLYLILVLISLTCTVRWGSGRSGEKEGC